MTESYVYNKRQVLSFGKTSAPYGGFSNMAPNYVVFVNEICVPNIEALYQACKFSLYPNIQRLILSEENPMKSKMISRQYQSYVRQDWELIKYEVMEWCVRIKLLQNWDTFGSLLRESGNSIIVEYSTSDRVWGATPKDDNTLEGGNAMGKILMKVRSEYIETNIKPNKMSPPKNITGLLIYGIPVSDVYTPDYYLDE